MKSLLEHRPYEHQSDDWLQSMVEYRSTELANTSVSFHIEYIKNRISVLRKEQEIRGLFHPVTNAQGGSFPPYHSAVSFSTLSCG